MESNATRKSERAKWLEKLARAIPKGSEFLTGEDGDGKSSLEVWCGYLMQYPPDVLIAITPALIQKCSFFPSLAEISREAKIVMGDDVKIPTKSEAYEEVFEKIRRFGTYQGEPEWSHPAIGDALRGVGGYKRIALSENTVSDRARFFEIYETCRERHARYESMPPLTREVAQRYLKEIEKRAGRKLSFGSSEPKKQVGGGAS